MAKLRARTINQNKFECHTVISRGYDKQDDDDQKLNEIEFCFNLNVNQTITESEVVFIDLRSHSKRHIQNQE